MIVALGALLRLLYVVSCRLPFNSLDNFLVSLANFMLFIMRTVLFLPTIELLFVGQSTNMQRVAP